MHLESVSKFDLLTWFKHVILPFIRLEPFSAERLHICRWFHENLA